MSDDDLAARLEAASAAAAEVLTLAGVFMAPGTAAPLHRLVAEAAEVAAELRTRPAREVPRGRD